MSATMKHVRYLCFRCTCCSYCTHLVLPLITARDATFTGAGLGRMLKWIVFIVLLAGGGYIAYDYYMAGHHTRPEMPEGAFSLSFKNGLRGIVVDLPDEKATRLYFGVPLEVPFYLEQSWSWCHPPTNEDSARAAALMAKRDWPGQRLEAVCKITIEGEEIVRGLIVTVPKV